MANLCPFPRNERLTVLQRPTEKYLLALRCLKAALSIDPEHPKVHEHVVAFRQALDKDLTSLPSKVIEVLKSEFTAVAAGTDLKQFDREFREKHNESARHILASIRVQEKLGSDRATLAKELISLLQLQGVTLEDGTEILETLRSWRAGELDAFKTAAKGKWPEASAFA